MKDYSEIQCPCCGGAIFIQPKFLLQGSSFKCSNNDCGASVSLSKASYSKANNAMQELEKLKQMQA